MAVLYTICTLVLGFYFVARYNDFYAVLIFSCMKNFIMWYLSTFQNKLILFTIDFYLMNKTVLRTSTQTGRLVFVIFLSLHNPVTKIQTLFCTSPIIHVYSFLKQVHRIHCSADSYSMAIIIMHCLLSPGTDTDSCGIFGTCFHLGSKESDLW